MPDSDGVTDGRGDEADSTAVPDSTGSATGNGTVLPTGRTESEPPSGQGDTETSVTGRRSLLGVAAVVAVLALIALITWILVGRSTDSGAGNPEAASAPSAATAESAPPSAQTPAVTPRGPVVLSVDEVPAVPAEVGHEVYWAGPVKNRQYEYTLTAAGEVFLRYLPEDAEAGDARQLLTVATYPVADAYAQTVAGSQRPDAVSAQYTGGAFAVTPSEDATNAYFAFDGVPLLIEVFDPTPGRAWRLIESGQIALIS